MLLVIKTDAITLRLFLRGDIWLRLFLALISFVKFDLVRLIEVILRLHHVRLSNMHLLNDLPFALIGTLNLHHVLPRWS